MPASITRETCLDLDRQDPLREFREKFQPPANNSIFLDANSMGAMPAAVPATMQTFFTDAWVEMRRQGWNHFEWLERPQQIGASIAHLMGAQPEDVIACDNTTVNLYKLLGYAWRLQQAGIADPSATTQPNTKKQILTEDGNFPTDIYVAQGLSGSLAGNSTLTICTSRQQLLDNISENTAVVYLSHVDYRSSERWDMREINRRAHEVGAVTVWDLSHSTGAIPVDLMGDDADFAVGCGYKYLSGGPGGSAYLWVHPRHSSKAWPSICGWMGHQDVFAFATHYEPRPGAPRHATGTPAVIANEIFACAAEIWRQVDATQLWHKHQALGDLMINSIEQECAEYGVTVNTPRDYCQRGGHIGFSHEGAGPLCEALLEAGVIGSFRKPDALRFGLGALYLSYEDIWESVQRMKDILSTERWRESRFEKVSV